MGDQLPVVIPGKVLCLPGIAFGTVLMLFHVLLHRPDHPVQIPKSFVMCL